MIAIVDYGLGNLKSVKSALDRLGVESAITSQAAAILAADGVIFPGVGAFQRAMENLGRLGLVEPLRQVAQSGRPFLGICLGLQLLFSESEEFGVHRGLDVIPGRVVRFPEGMQEGGEDLKVPHMGWNQLAFKRRAPVFAGLADGDNVYFVHSYYVQPEDAGVVATTTGYGIEFCSSIWKDNIVATQFHPEKSQEKGLRMLRNFGEMKG